MRPLNHEEHRLLTELVGPAAAFGWLVAQSGVLVAESTDIGVVGPAVAMGVVAGLLLRQPLRRLSGAAPRASQPHSVTVGIRLLRRVVHRERVDAALDRLRLRIDTFPHGLYQPVASLPVRAPATRAAGSRSRWAAMRPVIQATGARNALDLGANAGYFSIGLGELGMPTIAVESEPTIYRTALLAVRRSGVRNVGVLALELRPETLSLLPPADCVLFLSLWHHLVREHDVDVATRMLDEIWSRTGKVLFFDTGESEMPASFRLPAMQPDPRTWLEGYLTRVCTGARVEHLGRHAAFDAEGRPCTRNLFAALRSGGGPGVTKG
jgi:hypothetical protein